MKPFLSIIRSEEVTSHPAGVRGLKPRISGKPSRTESVAPRRGAWIETFWRGKIPLHVIVAPRRGAWIETSSTNYVGRREKSRTPQGCVD